MDEELNMIRQCNTVTKRQILYWIASADISCKTSNVIFQQWLFSTLLFTTKLEKCPYFGAQSVHSVVSVHKRTKNKQKEKNN